MCNKDLTDKKFGKLTVVCKNDDGTWLCKCDCDNIVNLTTSNLNSGNNQSCGCLYKEIKIKRDNEIAGKKFNFLTATKEILYKNGRPYRKFICDCANVVFFDTYRVKNGILMSCGCEKYKHRIGRGPNLLGEVYGRLLVIGKEIKNKRQYWVCLCFCGNATVVLGHELESGHQKSCGCLCVDSNFDPTITKEERYDRRMYNEYINWAKAVKKRDNYTCQCCFDSTGGNLVSHHLNAYKTYEDQRTDIDNGITLCTHCHKEFHKRYGSGKNTKEQYLDFEAKFYIG